jgi:hypothetical protein
MGNDLSSSNSKSNNGSNRSGISILKDIKNLDLMNEEKFHQYRSQSKPQSQKGYIKNPNYKNLKKNNLMHSSEESSSGGKMNKANTDEKASNTLITSNQSNFNTILESDNFLQDPLLDVEYILKKN